MVSIEGNTFTGEVRSTTSVSSTRNISGYYEVVVNTNTYKISCPCRYYEEFGKPCYHGMAIIVHNQLDPNNPNWWSKLYHIESYAEMYGSTLPLPTTDGKISVVNVLPPDFKRTSGRPKKKRYTTNSGAPRICKLCGGVGHFASTCPAPKTLTTIESYEKQTKKVQREVTAPAIMDDLLYCEDIIAIGKTDIQKLTWNPDIDLYRDEEKKWIIEMIRSNPNWAAMVDEMDQVVPGLGPIVVTITHSGIVAIGWLCKSRIHYDSLYEVFTKHCNRIDGISVSIIQVDDDVFLDHSKAQEIVYESVINKYENSSGLKVVSLIQTYQVAAI